MNLTINEKMELDDALKTRPPGRTHACSEERAARYIVNEGIDYDPACEYLVREHRLSPTLLNQYLNQYAGTKGLRYLNLGELWRILEARLSRGLKT